MNWHAAIGILSTIALFAPVFIIVAFKLIRYKQFIPLFIYCLFAFTYNLFTENLIVIPKNIERTYGIINNLTDMPLMFSFLIFQIASSWHVKRMKILLGVYILFEIAMIFIYGLNIKMITIVMAPGLSIVFGYSLYFFVNAVKRSFIHTKYAGKALIASGLCFAYGCFIFIYLMHYIAAIEDIPNIFLIYYIVTIIYSSLLSIGLVMESKRKKKVEEMLETRRELMKFFADEKKTATPKEVTGLWKLN